MPRPVRRKEGALFFFRVVATSEGFECRRGRDVLGRWPTLAEALDSCRGIAAQHRPSVVYLHDATGKVTRVASFDLPDPA